MRGGSDLDGFGGRRGPHVCEQLLPTLISDTRFVSPHRHSRTLWAGTVGMVFRKGSFPCDKPWGTGAIADDQPFVGECEAGGAFLSELVFSDA